MHCYGFVKVFFFMICFVVRVVFFFKYIFGFDAFVLFIFAICMFSSSAGFFFGYSIVVFVSSHTQVSFFSWAIFSKGLESIVLGHFSWLYARGSQSAASRRQRHFMLAMLRLAERKPYCDDVGRTCGPETDEDDDANDEDDEHKMAAMWIC